MRETRYWTSWLSTLHRVAAIILSHPVLRGTPADIMHNSAWGRYALHVTVGRASKTDLDGRVKDRAELGREELMEQVELTVFVGEPNAAICIIVESFWTARRAGQPQLA